jgi:hypothetical protein
MQMLRAFWDAASALDPDAAGLHEGTRFASCRPESLQQLLQRAGLDEVDVAPVDVATPFRDLDDYWQPFLGGQGPAASYLAKLAEDRREALRRSLAASLPVAADGSLPLTARAWAVRGRVRGMAGTAAG